MEDRSGRHELTFVEWVVMLLLGAGVLAYGTVSARTGLPPQPETVAGPIFDQAAGAIVAVFAIVELTSAFWFRRRRRTSALTEGRPGLSTRDPLSCDRSARNSTTPPPNLDAPSVRRHRRAPARAGWHRPTGTAR
jgi:hypothetical protein